MKINLKDLERDVKILLNEDLYEIRIIVGGDAGNLSLSMNHFVTNEQIMGIWKNIGESKKNPTAPVFPELKRAIVKLNNAKKSLYDAYCIQLQVSELSEKRVVTLPKLPEIEEAFASLKNIADEERAKLIELQPQALQFWMEKTIIPLIDVRYANAPQEEKEMRIKQCTYLFPSIRFLKKKFGVELECYPLITFKSLIKNYASIQEDLAKANAAKVEIVRTQAEIDIARAKVEAAEIEAQEKIDRARAETRVAEELCRRKLKEQEQAIQEAIYRKVDEVRDKFTLKLHEMLTQIYERDYNPAKMPPSFKKELNTLIEQAKVVSQVDRNLESILDEFKVVSKNPDSMSRKIQLDGILKKLEDKFQEQTNLVYTLSEERSLTRAQFLMMDL